MINGRTWPNPHLALAASGDKSGALVRDGVRSALQGRGLTPTETLGENGLNIHCRQAAHSEPCSGNVRDVSGQKSLEASARGNHTRECKRSSYL